MARDCSENDTSFSKKKQIPASQPAIMAHCLRRLSRKALDGLLNARDALGRAATARTIEGFDWLLDHGADLSIADRERVRPIKLPDGDN